MVRSWLLAAVLALGTLTAAAPVEAQATPRPKEVTIHAGTYDNGTMYLEPDRVTAKPGQNVTVTLINDDWRSQSNHTPHDVIIKGIEGPRQGGECQAVPKEKREREQGETFVELEVCDQPRTTVSFTVPENPQERVHEMECEVPGHAEAGMVGEFVIQGAGGTQSTPVLGLGPGLAVLGALALGAARWGDP